MFCRDNKQNSNYTYKIFQRLFQVLASALLLYDVLIVCVPFPYGDWERTVMWNSVVSIFHLFVFCLFARIACR